MNRECEIQYELRAGDEEKDEDNTAPNQKKNSLSVKAPARFREKRETPYLAPASSTQHNPNVQPTVVSALRLRQSSTRSALKCFPAARAVKRIRTVPMR